MDLEIKNKIALVTGSSSGIGLSTAIELIKNGTKVWICARNESKLLEAEEIIKKETKENPFIFQVDVSKEKEITKMIDHIQEKHSKIDILINNAGRAQAGGVLDTNTDQWIDMFNLKVLAMTNLCKLVIPKMIENKWGRIVNMSSIGGVYPNPKLTISHALSAAIINITKSLALDVANKRILINSIGIGAINTDNWKSNMIPKVKKTRPDLSKLKDHEIIKKLGAELTPVGRFGKPEEIAWLACYLASNKNGFITGANIDASGGADKFM
jgi:3-oxoacyl-[acyl-carrier protein] reductase|tara:strand:- start:237 stop:1043 length:807 start_codon:yes stop_codon:yes gene_type:complete